MLTDKEAKPRIESHGLSSTVVQHIAKLARIELTPDEEDRMKRDLSSILGYIDQLNKVDTDAVEPLYQTTGLVNAMRADEHLNSFPMDERLNERLVGQAPHKSGRYIKVKEVLKAK
ncbi:MAG: Asp-tRNA(Asn)/Glu-tRNA(Gln) amidotransferase subunit GatC [Patescibacteria group bacterium]